MVKFEKFSTESDIFSEIEGESETEGNASLSQRGMDAPVSKHIMDVQDEMASRSSFKVSERNRDRF